MREARDDLPLLANFFPPRPGVSKTSRGKARNRHHACADFVLTASARRLAQAFENSGRTPLGMRLAMGELSLHNARKSASFPSTTAPFSSTFPFLSLPPFLHSPTHPATSLPSTPSSLPTPTPATEQTEEEEEETKGE